MAAWPGPLGITNPILFRVVLTSFVRTLHRSAYRVLDDVVMEKVFAKKLL